MTNLSLFSDLSGAKFSPCMRYRYRLWRNWEPEKGYVTFLMLNPSTANEIENDPTVERCQTRALDMGFGGLQVVNIFAYRSTDPRVLYGLDDPVGPENDAAILEATREAKLVVCAWGKHGNLNNRGVEVTGMLRAAGVQLNCLGTNQDGTPKHPLYVGYAALPSLYERTA